MSTQQKEFKKNLLEERRERVKREWKETARRNIDRALIFQSNTHVATQNTHTHF